MSLLPRRGMRPLVTGQAILVAAAALLGALVLGLLAATGSPRVGLVLAGALALPMLYLFLAGAGTSKRDAWFWVLLALSPLTSIVLAVSGVRTFMLIEIVLLASIPLTLWGLGSLFKQSMAWWLFTGLLLTYFVLAGVSSVLGQSSLFAAAFQTGTNLKFLFMILLGYYLAWTVRTERAFFFLVKWFCLALLPFVLLQLVAPSVALKIFPFSPLGTSNDLMGTAKVMGLFRHSSYLGFFAATFMLFSIVIARTFKKPAYYVSALVYFFLLLASGQRHELLTGLLLAFFAVVLSGERRPAVSHLLVAAGAAGLVFAAVTLAFWDYFILVARKMALIGPNVAIQPRSVLYADSVRLAEQYFPFGSGLGTFASAAAAKFDPRLYFDLGYRAFGWFGDNVLSDTFWPQHVGEAGFFGFMLFAAALLTLVGQALNGVLRSPHPDQRFYWLLALLGLLLVLSVSLASPIIEDPGLSALVWILYGVAFRKSVDWRNEHKPVRADEPQTPLPSRRAGARLHPVS